MRWERVTAEAATRSAEAAERSNRLAELAVAQRVSFGIPSEEGLERPEVEAEPAPDVSWRIERPSDGDRYVLRNAGSEIAEHVEVDTSQAGPITRNLPRDEVIRPGEGVDMLIKGVWGHPMPNQLYVRWSGQPDWVAVPIT